MIINEFYSLAARIKLSFFEIIVVVYINENFLSQMLGNEDLTTEDCTTTLTTTIDFNLGVELFLYL